MKSRLFVVMVAIVLSASIVRAQGGPDRRGGNGPRQTPEMRADQMAKDLSLNDNEKAKVLQLFKSEEEKSMALREEMKKLRESGQQPGEDMRAKMQELRKSNDAELTKILGKEKFEKWQSMRAEQMKQMRDGRGAQGEGMRQGQGMPQGPAREQMREKAKEMMNPEKRAEHLQKQLELTNEQKDALTQLFTQQEQKVSEERTQKMKEMKAENDAAIEKIIGKDKMAKLKEMRDGKMEKVKKAKGKKDKSAE